MGQKDIAEKTLEAYNDVFADIVNVLLFDGEPVIKEDELEDSTPVSQYKADGKLHEQERDVAKFWRNSSVRIALYGLENQTAIDINIPLRVISYDGAAYRAQLLDDNKPNAADGSLTEPNAENSEAASDAAARRAKRTRYPVVTLVLYFGEKRWNRPRSLHECLDIPEELKPFVSDYKVNVFEIAYLPDEQVQRFQSDFRYVAEYFTQARQNKSYQPTKEIVDHVQEVFTLMKILTQDEKFEYLENLTLYDREKGGVKTMSSYLSKLYAEGEAKGRAEGEAKGRAEGEAKGRAEGRVEGRVEGIVEGLIIALHRMVEIAGYSIDSAMDVLGITPEDRPKYRAALES